jgi:hypothetical protein
MKLSSHFSVPSQKWQGIGENDIGDDHFTPWMVASPQSMFPSNRARSSFRGTAPI